MVVIQYFLCEGLSNKTQRGLDVLENHRHRRKTAGGFRDWRFTTTKDRDRLTTVLLALVRQIRIRRSLSDHIPRGIN